jgi:DNA-binding XRE family transcriptional regulator
MTTLFKYPHVDSNVTTFIKLLFGIDNGRDAETLASLPTTLLNSRGLTDNGQYMRVFAKLSLVNRGVLSAEDFVSWFDATYPGNGVWHTEPEVSDDHMMVFAETVTARRTELGMTRTQLACRLGVAPSQVARWEDGGGMPRDATLVLLGAVLGYNPARLWALANGVAI